MIFKIIVVIFIKLALCGFSLGEAKMILFLIKKSFFNVWDNLSRVVLVNLGFVVCLFLMLFPAFVFGRSVISVIIFLFPGFVCLHLYLGAVGLFFKELSDSAVASVKLIKRGFRISWKKSLVLGLLDCAVLLAIVVGLPFYFSLNNILGFAGGILLFWAGMCWVMAAQFFFPLQLSMSGSLRTTIKKAFLITLDNPFFTFFVLVFSIFLFILSVIFAFIAPGIGSIFMLQLNALRLRLYKYDWLEENPDSPRNKIPWKELLVEEDERLGSRSFKGTIFPWRD